MVLLALGIVYRRMAVLLDRRGLRLIVINFASSRACTEVTYILHLLRCEDSRSRAQSLLMNFLVAVVYVLLYVQIAGVIVLDHLQELWLVQNALLLHRSNVLGRSHHLRRLDVLAISGLIVAIIVFELDQITRSRATIAHAASLHDSHSLRRSSLRRVRWLFSLR